MTVQSSPRFPIELALRSYASDLEAKYDLRGALLRQAADEIQDAHSYLSETMGFDESLTLGEMVRRTISQLTRIEEEAWKAPASAGSTGDGIDILKNRVAELEAEIVKLAEHEDCDTCICSHPFEWHKRCDGMECGCGTFLRDTRS